MKGETGTAIQFAKVNCKSLLRKVPDVHVNNIRDTAKEIEAIIAVAWAVQEEVFIVLNPSLTEAYGTRALKFMSKFMFAKVAKLDS